MRWQRVLLGGEGAIRGGLEVAAHGPLASARLTGQEASANRGAGEEQAAGAVVGEGADRRQSRRPLGPPPVPPLLSSSTSYFVTIEDIKFVLEMINTNWMAIWDIKNIIQAPHQHMAMIKRGLLET
uniref:Uncharacterized protein n=1 Tax=Oryza glumipatula TaxID=40148 RepID=A0A0D9YAD6_9ORYZ